MFKHSFSWYQHYFIYPVIVFKLTQGLLVAKQLLLIDVRQLAADADLS